MSRLLALALLAAVGMALLNPSLLPFVVGGTALALAPSLARLVQAAPRPVKRALAVLSLSLALAGAGAALVFWVPEDRDDIPVAASANGAIHVPIHYSGQARQQGEALIIEDSLTVGRNGLRRAAREGPLYRDLKLSTLADGIAARLKAKRWKISSSSEGLEFRRRRARPLPLRARWFPARTTNEIFVRAPGVGRVARGKPRVVLLSDRTSSLTVIAAPHTIGETSPRGSRRPRGEMERVTIPVPTDDDRVEVEVASPLLRNTVTSQLGDVTLSSATGVVMMFVLAMTGDGVKNLVKRLFRRIVRPRQPAPAEGDEG